MNNRIGILITGAAAVVVLIALAVLVAWSLRTETVDGSVEPPGSLLHPQVRQEARTGYVIAELYQDGRLDLESGVYDGDGTLRGSHWTHHDVRQTCSLDLVLAVQEGRDQASPTATPQPTHTPLPTDPPWNPEEYAVVERTIDTDNGAGIAVALLPTPRAGWPASTPRPTYTPYPTATPSPLVSSVSWIGWAGRPIVIAADGVALLDLPRDATVSANLSVWTGPHPNRPGPAGPAAFAGCAVVGRHRAPSAQGGQRPPIAGQRPHRRPPPLGQAQHPGRAAVRLPRVAPALAAARGHRGPRSHRAALRRLGGSLAAAHAGSIAGHAVRTHPHRHVRLAPRLRCRRTTAYTATVPIRGRRTTTVRPVLADPHRNLCHQRWAACGSPPTLRP